MPRSKSRKYSEIGELPNVYEISHDEIVEKSSKLSEIRNKQAEHNKTILELGCGYGEYTEELAKHDLENLYIGIERKGDRIWRGATNAIENSLENILFIRMLINDVDLVFEPQTVDRIWVTFPDPQPKSEKSRLVHNTFADKYFSILGESGLLVLKTDSTLLYEYLMDNLPTNYSLEFETRDIDQLENIDNEEYNEILQQAKNIQTRYEKKFRDKGETIKLVILRKK